MKYQTLKAVSNPFDDGVKTGMEPFKKSFLVSNHEVNRLIDSCKRYHTNPSQRLLSAIPFGELDLKDIIMVSDNAEGLSELIIRVWVVNYTTLQIECWSYVEKEEKYKFSVAVQVKQKLDVKGKEVKSFEYVHILPSEMDVKLLVRKYGAQSQKLTMESIKDVISHGLMVLEGVINYEMILSEDRTVSFTLREKQSRKFSSLKLSLMKQLYLPKEIKKMSKIGLITRRAMQLEESQLFTRINITDIPNPPDVVYSDFSKLPFDDFMLLMDNPYVKEDEFVKDGFLLRVEVVDDSLIYIYIYTKDKRGYGLHAILQTPTEQFGFTPVLSGDGSIPVAEMIITIKRVVNFINHYPTIVEQVTPTNSKFLLAVPANDRPKYIQYTLDLSKPTKQYSSTGQGGIHSSPIEHLRRGHERKYQSGKSVWVKSCVVNEGKGGRAERDYAVSPEVNESKLNLSK